VAELETRYAFMHEKLPKYARKTCIYIKFIPNIKIDFTLN
jgi:hypothetical protein